MNSKRLLVISLFLVAVPASQAPARFGPIDSPPLTSSATVDLPRVFVLLGNLTR